MNREKLIPDISTDDLEPKAPWLPQLPGAPLPPEEPPKKKQKSLFVKALLSFIIIAAIIGIGILLPIKLIPGASSMIASVFNSKNDNAANSAKNASSTQTTVELINFTASKHSIDSGESTKIAWEGPLRNGGKYSLTFPCIEGVKVTLLAGDGTTPVIACGEPFYFYSIDNTMTLKMESTTMRAALIPLSFGFIKDSGTLTKLGDLKITVNNNGGQSNSGQVIIVDNSTTSAPAPAPAPAPTPAPVPAPSTSGPVMPGYTFGQTGQTGTNSNGQLTTGYVQGASGVSTYTTGSQMSGNTTGTVNPPQNTYVPVQSGAPAYPDLAIRIIATGVLNTSTNAFSPKTTVSAGDRAAIQFEVINLGDSWSGTWQFAAALPTVDNKAYQSGPQASLAPHTGTIYTLGFDNIRDMREAVATLQVDTAGMVSESNEGNNTATAIFRNSNVASGTGTGKADLKATLIGTGKLSGSTFAKTNNLEEGDDAAVQFKVTNLGGTASGTWKFTATKSDGDDDFEYTSASQASLLPGQSAVLSVGFKDIDAGDYDIEIMIDPNRSLDESNRSNNKLSASLEVDN